MEQGTTATVRDVREADFATEVVEASRTRPVVVDFWAPWCGPCHQLSPLLERVAAAHVGEVDCVKVNVDEAQGVARDLGVQGIPAVMAFRDGRVVSRFTGVQPEHMVAQFFAALAPSEADRLAAAAAAAPDVAAREELLDRALALVPDHAGAVVAKARLLADRTEVGEARALLARVPGDDTAQRLLAELALTRQDVDEEELARLRAAVESGDPAARLALGRSLAALGRHEEALAELIGAVRHPATREEARTVVLDVFALLGPTHPTVAAFRPRLAAALF